MTASLFLAAASCRACPVDVVPDRHCRARGEQMSPARPGSERPLPAKKVERRARFCLLGISVSRCCMLRFLGTC
jgi:hypothetical protein